MNVRCQNAKGRMVRRVRFTVLLGSVAMVLFGGRAENVTNKWSFILGTCDSSAAVGMDGTVYFGTFNQQLWAVTSNGVVKWTFETRSEIKSSPALGQDGTVYFGCRDRKLYAVAPNGREKWAFATGGWVDSSPALTPEGVICFGSWDKKFYALNPDGTVKWRFETAGEIDSSPAIGRDGTVYFGSHDKKFYALSPEGRKKWEFAAGGPIISSPALNGDGAIYFTSVDGYFYALGEDGSLRWRLWTGSITASSPVIAGAGLIYVGVNESVWAITSAGQKKWDYQMGQGRFMESSPTVFADDSVGAISPYADLFRLDDEKRVVWNFYLGTDSRASPGVAADGTIYMRGRNSLYYALDPGVSLAQTPWPKFRGNRRNTGNLADAMR